MSSALKVFFLCVLSILSVGWGVDGSDTQILYCTHAQSYVAGISYSIYTYGRKNYSGGRIGLPYAVVHTIVGYIGFRYE